MKKFANLLVTGITRTEKVIAFVAFVLILGALSADVFGREIIGKGVFGAVKFGVYALIFCAMAGFGVATTTGNHLRPRVLDKLVPKSLEFAGIRIGQFASAAILLTLAYAGLTFVELGRMLEERDVTLDILIWPIQLAIPIGFALSALKHIIFGIWLDLLPEEQAVAE